MRTVELTLPPNELSRQMAMMRIWLDERRCQPSGFNCCEAGRGVVVRIDFKAAELAEAFAERFGGRVNEALPAFAEAELSRAGLSAEGFVG
ncbi:MAG TPA: hypothetical protein VGF34_17495 [Stellaceae bacterium]|jgi:hypothetical protein